ncbi:hypothetical protein F5972_00765 [Microbispora cellulosiformans]|uniref:PLOD1-3-like GT domain-containing protein n=1 Tax=Microbispora cellulosiformans TaxID=2614688 RepID=A0A5J5KC18_9ACTN|nr:glycosyltransferase domain-containing protein [Microbispora cellulosiformans]KAA9381414.1 hypothetical protein F5972_00765 [Microbispora cellulosiformans]
MEVVTVATDLNNAFLNRLLIPSCAALGFDLMILHVDKKEFRPRDKRLALVEYFKQHPSPTDLVIFTDAYDTLFIRAEKYVRETYARFSRSVVFSGELNNWPLGAIGFLIENGPPVRPFPYLNAGGFIGAVGDLLELCIKHPKPPSDRFRILRDLRIHDFDTDERYGFSDQYYWTLVHLLETETIAVDHHAELFECFSAQVPPTWDVQVTLDINEFRTRGREADSYHRERARLEERLRAPSGAAQLHFASPITKAVLLDLLDQGRLPAWLGAFDARDYPPPRVQRMTF